MSFIIGKETIFKIVEIVYLLIIFIVVLAVVSMDISREVRVGNVEVNTLIKKALYSGECFAYSDVRDRPLIIDINKFNNKTIDECIGIDRFSARFQLFLKDKTIEAINNEDRFLVDSRLCSFKGYGCFNFKKSILVYDKELKRGVLQIDATIKEA